MNIIDSFDRDFYLEQNPDVLKAHVKTKLDPYQHYLKNGKKEGRAPNADTDAPRYNKIFMPTEFQGKQIQFKDILQELTKNTQFFSFSNLENSELLAQIREIVQKREHWLFLSHDDGGGASMFLMHFIEDLRKNNIARVFSILIFNLATQEYHLYLIDTAQIYFFSNIQREILSKIKIEQIHVNELVHWPYEDNLNSTLQWIIQLSQMTKSEIFYYVHDFYCICPRITLIDNQQQYCIKNSIQACNNCVHTLYPSLDILQWRQNIQNFWQQCTQIRFFSHNTYQIVSKYIHLNEKQYKIEGHQNYNYPASPLQLPDREMRIAVIGSILAIKGEAVIENLAQYFIEQQIATKIFIIGLYRGKSFHNIYVTGRYNKDFLPEILQTLKITICLFPSICPETFSFVVQELMLLNLPVVCFNLGAQAERISQYAHGLVIDQQDPATVYQALKQLDSKRLQNTSLPAYPINNSYALKRNIFENILSKFCDPVYYILKYTDICRAFQKPDKMSIAHFKKWGFLEDRRPFGLAPFQLIEDVAPNLSSQQKYYLRIHYQALLLYLTTGLLPEKYHFCIGQYKGCATEDRYIFFQEDLTQKKLVTVVILSYNAEEFIEQCIQSALNQTLSNIDILIIDDGSQDQSQAIIQRYAQQDQRIKFIKHETNLGLLKAHQDGVQYCQTEYLAFLDGDDFLNPNFCEVMLKTAKIYQADLVCCQWSRSDIIPEPSFEKEVYGVYILDQTQIRNFCGNWGDFPNIHYGLNRKLHRKDLFQDGFIFNLRNRLMYCEDTIITNHLITLCNIIICIDNMIYHWRDNINSISYKKMSKSRIDDYFYVIKNLSLQYNNIELYYKNIRNMILNEFITLLKRNKEYDELKYLIYYFAHIVDNNSELFEIILQALSNQLGKIWYETECKRYFKDKILFIDNGNTNDIHDFILPEFMKIFDKDKVAYFRNDANPTLTETLERITWSCEARMIVASGGWSKEQHLDTVPILQVWHGLGALKYVDAFAEHLKPYKGFMSSRYLFPLYERLFGVGREKIFPYGSMTACAYLDQNRIAQARRKFLDNHPELEKKKIYLYCPTFRGHFQNVKAMQPFIDLPELDQLLQEDERLLIKLHPAFVTQNKADLFCQEVYQHIVNYSTASLYDLLAITNVFITDFSSSIYYAMLLNLPVVLYATDIDYYTTTVKLEIDYRQDMPGVIYEGTDSQKLLEVIRTARSDTDQYQLFKKYHLNDCTIDSKKQILHEILLTYHELSPFQ